MNPNPELVSSLGGNDPLKPDWGNSSKTSDTLASRPVSGNEGLVEWGGGGEGFKGGGGASKERSLSGPSTFHLISLA